MGFLVFLAPTCLWFLDRFRAIGPTQSELCPTSSASFLNLALSWVYNMTIGHVCQEKNKGGELLHPMGLYPHPLTLARLPHLLQTGPWSLARFRPWPLALPCTAKLGPPPHRCSPQPRCPSPTVGSPPPSASVRPLPPRYVPLFPAQGVNPETGTPTPPGHYDCSVHHIEISVYTVFVSLGEVPAGDTIPGDGTRPKNFKPIFGQG